MRKSTYTLLFALGLLLLSSCGEEKTEKNIITHKQTIVKQKKTEKMSDIAQDRSTEWVGGTYTISISRRADESLPIITDETGKKFFDNIISLKIMREDGTVFLERKFTKADFKTYVDDAYYKHGALLGVVFDKVEDNRLVFAASVGSPDITSDDYVPMVLTIDRMGKLSISEATTLDVDNDANAPEANQMDEDGV